jgi:hypothetical protein
LFEELQLVLGQIDSIELQVNLQGARNVFEGGTQMHALQGFLFHSSSQKDVGGRQLDAGIHAVAQHGLHLLHDRLFLSIARGTVILGLETQGFEA